MPNHISKPRPLFNVLDNIDGEIDFENYVAKNIFVGERTILNGNRAMFLEPLEASAMDCYHSICKHIWDYIHGKKHGKIDVLACLYLNSKGKYKLKKYKFVPYNWYNVYENFQYMVRDGHGRMPKIKQKEELPTIYSIKGEE